MRVEGYRAVPAMLLAEATNRLSVRQGMLLG